MIVPVTDAIIDAVLKIKLVVGSNEEVGRLLGVSKKHIGKILSGDVQYIQEDTWKKMEPQLRPHMPAGTDHTGDVQNALVLDADANAILVRRAAERDMKPEQYLGELLKNIDRLKYL